MVTANHDGFDLPCLEVIAISEKCDRSAFLASTTCAAYAMNVVFSIFRRIVVDNERNPLHVQTTSCHISRTYDLSVPVAQIVQSLLSGRLILVSMDRITSYFGSVESIFELLAGLLCIAENHGAVVTSSLL
jgi:hypothetical protein